jgi:hypothetical protein
MKKTRRTEEKRTEAEEAEHFFRFFLLFCFALPVFADLKISPYQRRKKSVSHRKSHFSSFLYRAA